MKGIKVSILSMEKESPNRLVQGKEPLGYMQPSTTIKRIKLFCTVQLGKQTNFRLAFITSKQDFTL